MAEPILAANDKWFTQGCDGSIKLNITQIELMDSYIPDSSVNVDYSWDASAALDESVMCYVLDQKLIISGNGSGKIYANSSSTRCFGPSYSSDYMSVVGTFKNVANFIRLPLLDTSKVTKASAMFQTCMSLTSLDLTGWDLSSCTHTASMFQNDSALLEIVGSSELDVSKAINMSSMFEECKSLKNIDVSNWNPSSCVDMSFMFYNCSSLKEIDVSNWDVSKVTNFDHFAAHANLKRKGIENWKTTSATNMNALFHNCAEEELDLSGWDVSKVQFFCQMFENSPNLKRIKGLEKWNTSAGLGFDGMFERCSKLEEVNLSSFDTTKAKNGTSASTNGHKTATLSNMFLSCNNLKKVKVGPNFSINGDGSNTTAANKAILPHSFYRLYRRC